MSNENPSKIEIKYAAVVMALACLYSVINSWEGVSMNSLKKVYGYVTRIKDEKTQVLVFQHSIPEAGIQIPKGTVNEQEDTYHAMIREIKEETGLKNFIVEKLIAEDDWKNDDGEVHNRFFYRINVNTAPDEWDYQPTGENEEGLTFHYFWISSRDEVELVRGHGDYLHHVFI